MVFIQFLVSDYPLLTLVTLSMYIKLGAESGTGSNKHMEERRPCFVDMWTACNSRHKL